MEENAPFISVLDYNNLNKQLKGALIFRSFLERGMETPEIIGIEPKTKLSSDISF